MGNFTPQFDAAGNQTLVKTSTGIWRITYNAENRPVRFENDDGNIVVECSYDYMGRRATKKVSTNGEVTLHQRYIYRGYLQIAACDCTRVVSPCLWLILWDPTQATATRPLAIQKDGTWYTYGWDLTKNICEVYGQSGYIRTLYTYSPYGAVTAEGDVIQPIQWSSELFDDELGLVYYNYRHYNLYDGRWCNYDPMPSTENPYMFASNSPSTSVDYIGMWRITRESSKWQASACAEQGDTWQTLAAAVNMDADDIQNWVVPYESQVKVGKTYLIPNTTIRAWYGEARFLGRFYTLWYNGINSYHKIYIYGFRWKTDNAYNELGRYAMDLSQKRVLYGVHVMGHGFNDLSGVVGKKINGVSTTAWAYEDVRLNYKLAIINFRTCYSGGAKDYCAKNASQCDTFKGTYIPMPIGWGFDI